MLRSQTDSALRAVISTLCRGRLSLTQPGAPAVHQPGWTCTLHSSSAAAGALQQHQQQQQLQQQANCDQQQQALLLLRQQPAALWQASKRRPAAAVGGDNSRAAFHSKPDVASDQADERLNSSNPYTSVTSSSSSSSSSGGGGGHARPRPLPAAGRAQRRAAAHSYLAAATQRMEAAVPQPSSLADSADQHNNNSSSMASPPTGQPDLVMSQVLAATADRLHTPPLHTNSIRRPPGTSLRLSCRGGSSSSDGDTSSSSSSTGDPESSSPSSSSSSGGRRAPLSNMLAAAAQRLAASPQAVSSRLRTLQANSSSSSSIGSSSSSSGAASVQAHTRHSLPAVELDQQQRQMLDKAIAVIDRLRARGYSAFIAGGWVRDAYLGRHAADIDIATSAPPFKVRGIFQGDPMVDLPRSTVKLTHQGEVFELSFFKGISRTSSLFSVGMDAACRDFTVNALYYDPATNEVLDFVGGVADARSRTLRLTADDPKRLADDPLRVLRGVRFATVLGLKLAPGTAVAMGQHAAACSLNAGVPPRRIWLELRKLAKAEAGQPGSWPHALRLSFHLGLLPHLFPWLQQQQQQHNPSSSSGSSSGSTVIDPFGYGVSKGASSSSSGAGGISNGGRAVLVAERLSQLWQQQQQQQQGAAAEGIPLPLLVAATVHPSAESFAAAEPYLQQLFPSQQEWDSIQALKTATQLLRGSPEASTSSSSSSEAGPAAGGDGWAQFYCHPHAGLVLMVLSCWMPEALAAGFLRTHQARMAASRRR